MKVCPQCGVSFTKREGEKPHRFLKRKFCSQACNAVAFGARRPDTTRKGELASDGAKRNRARRAFPLGECEEPGCSKRAVDHHHVNGDPGDNRAENIERLCRAHHRARHAPPEAPCRICGGPAPRSARIQGRCRLCASYLQRTGKERPWKQDGRREGAARGVAKPALLRDPIPCSNCGIETKPAWRGRCRKCYDYWRLHGRAEERAAA